MFLLSMQTGLIDMKLPQRYSIVKDSNVEFGVIFSIVQIGPLSRLSALKGLSSKPSGDCIVSPNPLFFELETPNFDSSYVF